MLIYYCECSCEVAQADIIQVWFAGSKKYVCPKHKDAVEYRTTICEDPECGVTFEISRVGKIPKFCIPCRIKKGISLSKYRGSTLHDAVTLAVDSKVIPRSDCVYRYECLAEAAFKDQKGLCCSDCGGYAPKPPEATSLPTNRHYDYTANACGV